VTSDVPCPPQRPADGHKGDFGIIAVVGGCHDEHHVMLGAPTLVGLAALRAGCGGVQLLVPRPLAVPALVQLCEATVTPLPVRGSGYLDQEGSMPHILRARCDAMVFGPGLGTSRTTSGILRGLLAAEGPPTVIDADGLNAVARCDEPLWPAGRPVVLTPHPGEYARLAQHYGLPAAGSDNDSRRLAARALAEHTDTVVVLKGHGTVVAGPDGSTWTCTCGTNVLAVPGSGDVLSGLIAALIAQCARAGHADLAAASRLAVEVHARAGLAWAQSVSSRGMLAHELTNHIAGVLEELAS